MIDLIPSDDQLITKRGKIPRMRILMAIGILLTLLFFNFAVVSANNSTDLNVTTPNSTLVEPLVIANITQNVTSVPTTLVPDTTLIPNTTLIPGYYFHISSAYNNFQRNYNQTQRHYYPTTR